MKMESNWVEKFFLIVVLNVAMVIALPVVSVLPKEHSFAVDFLRQYKYLDISSNSDFGNLMDINSVSDSIKNMQKFAGLRETGVLDRETLAVMHSSRCGVPDIKLPMSARRVKRFAIHHWKWPKRILTWRIENYGNDGIPKSLVRKTIKKALTKWQNATNILFKEAPSGKADILLKFVIGKHGDPTPFKKPWDGAIAHAYYPKHARPGLAGDVHFNDDKVFSVNSYKGKNLLWITLHELGHSIGMEHSKVKGSTMYPYYQSYNGKESDLTDDDRKGAQALYGVKDPSATFLPPVVPKPKPKPCLGHITAVLLAIDKTTYIFSHKKIYILKKSLGIMKGPIKVSAVFKGVKRVDAAFTRHDGKIVLFSKSRYFVFSSQNKYISGPHLTKYAFSGLSGINGRIDSAFIWPRTNALYITKGNQYWRYYPRSKGSKYSPMAGYPKDLARVWGVPNDLDAAFTWSDGATYAFKGNKYYKIKSSFRSPKGHPKLTSNYWGKTTSCQRESNTVMEEKGKNSASRFALQVMVVTFLVTLNAVF